MAYLNGNMNIMRFVTRESEAPRYKGIFPLKVDSVGGAVSDWYLYGNKEGVGEKRIVKGNLPLDFASDGTDLENYRLFGTAEGAGITKNLFKNLFNKNAPYTSGKYLNTSGEEVSGATWGISEYIPIKGNTTYTAYNLSGGGASACWYDENKNFIDGENYGGAATKSFSLPSNARYIRLTLRLINPSNIDTLMLIKGTISPSEYIPYGYKIPIIVTNGTETKTTDIYIGDSKLGAEEYVDYGEQKIYKRTKQLLKIIEIGSIYSKSTGDTAGKDAENSTRCRTKGYVNIDASQNYTVSSVRQNVQVSVYTYNQNNNLVDDTRWYDLPYTFTAEEFQYRFVFRYLNNTALSIPDEMGLTLIEGSTSPENYIPYLQPTDPPLPFPAIETFEGTNTLDSTIEVGETMITQGYHIPLDIRSLSDTNEITKSKRADIIETAGATINVDIQAGTVTINGTTNNAVAEVIIFMDVTEGDYWYSGVPKQEDNSIMAKLFNTHILPPYDFNKWDGSEPGSDIGYGEEATVNASPVRYRLSFAPNHTFNNLVIKPKVQKATITDTANIYVGNKPLGKGEMVSRESTSLDIELERGQSVFETTITNKPEMIVTPDSYEKIKDMLLNIQPYDYNETQTDYITDDVTEVTQ